MVWNKTPEWKVKAVIQVLEQYLDRSYKDIAKEFEVSEWLVGQIAKQNLTKEQLKLRYSSWCKKTKQGDKNPMFGKKGYLHHNSVEEVRVSGYRTVFCPDWYKGKTVKSGRIFEHIFTWCSFMQQSSLPKGCVIHHIDMNIDNNTIENLQLLTIGEHVKLHFEIRKVQRLSRKGVGISNPEAQGIQ